MIRHFSPQKTVIMTITLVIVPILVTPADGGGLRVALLISMVVTMATRGSAKMLYFRMDGVEVMLV